MRRLAHRLRGTYPAPAGLWLAGILLVGLVLRLVWALYATRPPQGLHDPFLYSFYADGISQGRGYRLGNGQPTASYPVGYPAVLGLAFRVGHLLGLPSRSPGVASGLNLVAGMLTVFLAFHLARRLMGPRTGLAAAALLALFPNLVFHTAAALSETVFNALVVGGLWVLVAKPWSQGEPRRWRLVSGGLLFGLATLVRPLAILVVLVVVVTGRRVWGWRGALLRSGVILLVALVTVSPWVVRNLLVMHAPVISTNVGDDLCIGHHPAAPGRFVLADYCQAGLPRLLDPKSERERDSEQRRRALEFALHHPGDELWLIGKRAFFLIVSDHDGLEAVESYGDSAFIDTDVRPYLELMANSFFYGVVALALVGARSWGRGRPEQRLVLWTAVAFLAVPLAFFGDPRFHVPAVPLMCVMAAGPLLWHAAHDPCGDIA